MQHEMKKYFSTQCQESYRQFWKSHAFWWDFFAFLFLCLVQKDSSISEVKLQEETASREDLFCICEFRLNHNEYILPSLFCVYVQSFVLLVVKVYGQKGINGGIVELTSGDHQKTNEGQQMDTALAGHICRVLQLFSVELLYTGFYIVLFFS